MDVFGDFGDIDFDGVDVGKVESVSQDDGGDDVEDVFVVCFVNKMLFDVICGGFFDLYFEFYEKIYWVCFCIDGMFYEVVKLLIQLVSCIFVCFKVMVGLDIFE